MAREVVRLEGLEGVVKTLKELGPAASKAGGPVRATLRKAGVLIQKQELQNLTAIIVEPNADNLPTESTGLLQKNIVVTRSKPPPGQKGERMIVRVRRKAYPKERARTDKVTVTSQVARLLEYGTDRMRPHPFIRPAFDAKKGEALALFERELPRAIVALQKKLARKNGAKL